MVEQILESSAAAVEQVSGAVSEAVSEASSSSSSGGCMGGSGFGGWAIILLWIAVFAIAYLLFIRPQKKRQKAEEELRSGIEIGDDVTTIGGIVGRVISVRDDDETIIIETGSDKTRMRFKKWAIASVDTPEKQIKKDDAKNKKDKDENGKKSDNAADDDGKKKKDKKDKED